MVAALMHTVRVVRDNQERNGADDERESIENSRLKNAGRKAAEFFEILHRAG